MSWRAAMFSAAHLGYALRNGARQIVLLAGRWLCQALSPAVNEVLIPVISSKKSEMS